MTSEHYKSAYDKLFNSLPKWKQIAVKEDSVKNHWSGILLEFVQNVILKAENDFDNFVMSDEPPKYSVELEKKLKKKIKKS